jgi:hypothetical protein
MSNETLNISLQADIKQFRAELANMPGVGKKEAAAMVRNMVSEYKKAEKAAKDLADKTERSMGEAADKAKDTVERAAGLMGGAFGDVSDSVFDLGGKVVNLSKSLGGTAGAATLAAGGAAALGAAAYFTISALNEWMASASELRDVLEGVRGIEPLAPETIAAIEDYERATAVATATQARMTLELQGELAPALTSVRYAWIGLTAAISDVTDLADGMVGIFDGLNEAAASASGGVADLTWALTANTTLLGSSFPIATKFVGAFQALAAYGREAAEGVQVLTDAQREAVAAAQRGSDTIYQTDDDAAALAAALGVPFETLSTKAEKATKATKQLSEAMQKAREYGIKDLEILAGMNDQEISDLIERNTFADFSIQTTQQMQAAEAARFATIQAGNEKWAEQLRQLQGEAEKANEAIRDMGPAAADGLSDATVMFQALNAQSEQWMPQLQDILGGVGQIADAMAAAAEAAAEKRIEAAELESEATQARLEANAESIRSQLAAGKLTEQEANRKLRGIEAQKRADAERLESTKKAENEQLLKSFKASQTVAKAQVLISAAQATLALLASPAYALLGPGAVPAIALVVGGQVAAGMAQINAQEPPEFPDGGAIASRLSSRGASGDHVMVGVRPDEGVVSPAGMAAVGGPAGLAALNRGMGGATAAGPTVVALNEDIVGVAVQRALERSPSLVRQLRSGRVPGLRRR